MRLEMAGKKKEVQLQTLITDEEQWDEMLQMKGIVVIEVYQAWCGPCKAVQNLLRKLRIDFSEDNLLHFAAAEVDNLEILKPFRRSCEPLFLFSVHGKIIAMVKGVNAPLITKTVTDLVEEERQIAAGEKERAEVEELVFHDEGSSDGSEIFTYSVGIIKPDNVLAGRVEEIKRKIIEAGFGIEADEERMLTEDQIKVFYSRKKDEPDFNAFVQFMTSRPCHVLIITKKEATGAIPHWIELRKKSEAVELEEPINLRAEFAFEHLPINQLHGSSTPSDAQKELQFFFPEEHTFAVIKPDAATPKDEILKKVKEAGFNIAKIKEQALTREMALHFYKDHEGKPFFDDLVNFMTQGPSVIMVLTKENAVEEWKKLMGPTDPEEAKKTCPESIRAQFANEILANSVYGSSDIEQAERSIQF
ncbi:hypothetical protein EK904_005306, partial [Melospiza melodia maxima]